MKNWKVIIVFVGVVVILLAIFSISSVKQIPLPSVSTPQSYSLQEKSQEKVSLVIDYGDGKVYNYDIPFTEGINVFQVLQTATAGNGIDLKYEEYSGLGALVTQIGPSKGGEGRNYWQFWVNGKYATTGATSHIVQPGDIIEWKFTNGQQ